MGILRDRARAAVLAFLDDSPTMRQAGASRDGLGLRTAPGMAEQLRRQAAMARQAAQPVTAGRATTTTPPAYASGPPIDDDDVRAAVRWHLDTMDEQSQGAMVRRALGSNGMVQGNWAGLNALPSDRRYKGDATQRGWHPQTGVPTMSQLPRDGKYRG